MENQDKKRELIIEAALKRFAHFGLAKTTMTEIAADLSLSKALLYYYFPDKISLYSAVLESIINEIGTNLSEGVKGINDSEEALIFFLDKRHEYIQKYYNILDYIRVSGPDLAESITTILEKAKAAEISLIATVIQQGIDKKELKVSNAVEAASLLMDAFMGMRYMAFNNKLPFQLSKNHFEDLLDKQKSLSTIFLNGLK
ncbi:MAG: TetR/AcrR family transcriptional regulator [Sphingobacteriaceae bacterium]